MARFRGSKNHIARKFGVNIFGRSRNPLLHKPNPPGVHGARRRKKSDYGVQLYEKQKLKAVYGMISERQLVNCFKKAQKMHGNTPQLFVQQLECRLDVAVYRLLFAPTIFAAQQLVSHGHILVNGKKVDIRSFQVRPGMTISIREKSRNLKAIDDSLQNSQRSTPEYYLLEKENYSGQLLAMPQVEQLPWPIEINLPEICDFLAHST